MFSRYSPTREVGANHTACTKLTIEDKQSLHWMAIERGMSDYELTRRILVEYIRGRAPARPMVSRPEKDTDCPGAGQLAYRRTPSKDEV